MTAHAAIYAARKQLGLDDDTARDLYARVTGKRSLGEMSPAEQDRVVQELRRQGFTRGSSGTRKRLEGRYATKLQALWIAGWNLGVFRDQDDNALIAFVERQTGLSHVRFLHDHGDALKAIEALKGWMTREGKVEWHQDNFLPDWMRLSGAKIAVAQWNILVAAGAASPSIAEFRKLVMALAKPVDQIADERDWQPVMNALGERVRKVRK